MTQQDCRLLAGRARVNLTLSSGEARLFVTLLAVELDPAPAAWVEPAAGGPSVDGDRCLSSPSIARPRREN